MQTMRMNNITLQCTVENTFGKQYLSNTHITILVVTNTILLLGNIFSNSLVICLLVITRQLSNYSNKFTMLLSSSDVATALIVQTLQISVLFLPLDPPCPVSLLTQFFFNSTSKNFRIYYRNNRIRPLCSRKVHNAFSEDFNAKACVHFDEYSLCNECYKCVT